jgi:hypothetical protein
MSILPHYIDIIAFYCHYYNTSRAKSNQILPSKIIKERKPAPLSSRIQAFPNGQGKIGPFCSASGCYYV